MKSLLVMRHAKSSWRNSHLSDHDRPLNKRGKRDAPRMGALLAARDLLPEIVLCSSAERAHDTALRMAIESGLELDLIHTLPHLYHADTSDYLEALGLLPDGVARAMVVGHNPGLEDLVETLGGGWERMPTAAVAHIELPIAAWSELSDETEGRLVELWLPRELSGA
jgi:phosphohistidine phosphatase